VLAVASGAATDQAGEPVTGERPGSQRGSPQEGKGGGAMTTGKPEDKELTRQIEAEKQADNLVTVGWPFKCPVCNGTGIVSIQPGIHSVD
jgi:hypothetical protein